MQGAVFDVDGTLLDSMDVWEDAAPRYLQSIDVRPEADLTRQIETMSLEEGADYLIAAYDLRKTKEEVIQGVWNIVRHAYEEEIPLKPGARSFLEKLAEKKIPMAAATSGEKACVEAAFSRLGITRYFTAILTCAEAGAGKTQPDIYYKAAKLLGTAPKETWVFEDALYALETAKKAGFRTVGIYDAANREQEKLKAAADVYLKTWQAADRGHHLLSL